MPPGFLSSASESHEFLVDAATVPTIQVNSLDAKKMRLLITPLIYLKFNH